MHWSYDDLMALPVDVYDELIAWLHEDADKHPLLRRAF